VRALISPRAEKRVEAIDAHWAAPIFRDELDAAIARLETSPEMGEVYTRRRQRLVRRVLLEKSQQYLYYTVDHEAGEIQVLTVWGTARRRGPRL
jgi:plasmid stabilization system protein ParE